jgi:hypothetical protein
MSLNGSDNMFITNEDLMTLMEINVELQNKKLDLMIRKLLKKKEKTNKQNWKRIKTKRQEDKNYARSKKERGLI